MAVTSPNLLKPSYSVTGSQAPAEPAQFAEALSAWSQTIGAAYVDVAPPILDRYGRTTGPRASRPLAVLHPDSTSQVQQIVKIAARFGIGIHPISRGKNWGYGDAAPTCANQVLVDLGRMNRIVDLNDKLGYVVLEPGVTQKQLYDYLQEQAPDWWMDVTGAGLETSIMGNTLDRGFGHTRYGDHSLTTCGLEVVLGDGRLLKTGLGHYQNARANRAYRHGVGPNLEGLFTQSNFGIVTQMGIYLMPKPEAFSAFFIAAPRESDLPELIDALAKLRMQGLLQSAIHIANDLRAISGRMRYPWDRAGQTTPLPADLRRILRSECAVGAWNVCGAISGTKATVAGTQRALQRALPNHRIIFLNDRKIQVAERMTRLLGKVGLCNTLASRLEIVKPVYGLLKGIPSNEPLRGASWRVRDAEPQQPTDPLDCHAGLMWIAPILPADGPVAAAAVSMMEPIYQKHGFDSLLTLTFVTERALCCVSNISFDRRRPDEVARAQECYRELTERLMRSGYILYRSSPQTMKTLAIGSSGFWDVSASIKHALDPQGILSRGRYEPAA